MSDHDQTIGAEAQRSKSLDEQAGHGPWPFGHTQLRPHDDGEMLKNGLTNINRP